MAKESDWLAGQAVALANERAAHARTKKLLLLARRRAKRLRLRLGEAEDTVAERDSEIYHLADCLKANREKLRAHEERAEVRVRVSAN